jgi:hypothetical protein
MDRTCGTGEVKDPVDFHDERFRYVMSNKFETGMPQEEGDIFFSAGEIIVKAENVVTVIEKPLAKMRSDKPCAAGNKDLFRILICMVIVHRLFDILLTCCVYKVNKNKVPGIR